MKAIAAKTSTSVRPKVNLVCGNDKTSKAQLAAKLVGEERPLDFDAINGIAVIGSGE